MQILVVDVGGTHVKILATGQEPPRKFVSGSSLTAEKMVAGVLKAAEGWKYEVVSIGYPGRFSEASRFRNRITSGRLGRFRLRGCVSVSRQAHQRRGHASPGSYERGKMLFLGLGTGLGSAMIVDGIVEPMELSHLPYRKGTYEDYVGSVG